MIPIDYRKVPLKYRINFTQINPSELDLLYEITEFLYLEDKEEFNEWELKNKTKSRIPDFDTNVQFLMDKGYLEKGKYTKYKLVKHLWQ